MAVGVSSDLEGRWKWQIVLVGGVRAESDYEFGTWLEALTAVAQVRAAAEAEEAQREFEVERRRPKRKR